MNKEEFLAKVLDETVESQSIKYLVSAEVDIKIDDFTVEILAVENNPCDLKALNIPGQRYPLVNIKCAGDEMAKQIVWSGLDAIHEIEHSAADYNNLACAAMWVPLKDRPEYKEHAKKWIEAANNENTQGYPALSGKEKTIIQENKDMIIPPPPIVIPLYLYKERTSGMDVSSIDGISETEAK